MLASVKRAEQAILEKQDSKTYVAIAGNAGFNKRRRGAAVRQRPSRAEGRPRVHGADARRQRRLEHRRPSCRAREDRTREIYVSDPTWPNHQPLLKVSGLQLDTYPYYDYAKHRVDFDADAGAARQGERRRARADPRLLPQPVRRGSVEGAVAGADAALRAARSRAVHRHRVSRARRRPRRGRVRRAAHGRAAARGRRRDVVLEESRPLSRARGRGELRLGECRSGEARGSERGERGARHLLDAARSRRRDRQPTSSATRRCARSGSRSSRRCAAG